MGRHFVSKKSESELLFKLSDVHPSIKRIIIELEREEITGVASEELPKPHTSSTLPDGDGGKEPDLSKDEFPSHP
jgi:hypothetical protein